MGYQDQQESMRWRGEERGERLIQVAKEREYEERV